MSQREDRIRTAVVPAFAGINERSAKTDLQSQESVLLEGSFPLVTGQQTRIPGKALLKKFAESVYGIHQFWTPYGYGNNIYQYDGTIGVDPWITPPGKPIKNPPLPPTQKWDDSLIILDDLGNSPQNPGNFPTIGGVTGGTGETSNGTTSTPGSSGRLPRQPEASFTLTWFYLWINFGGAGVQVRTSGDVLRLYTKNPKDGGVYINQIGALAPQWTIDDWNALYPYATVGTTQLPTIGTPSEPVPPDPVYITYDPYVNLNYYANGGPYWNANLRMFFLDTGEVYSQVWNGYYL